MIRLSDIEVPEDQLGLRSKIRQNLVIAGIHYFVERRYYNSSAGMALSGRAGSSLRAYCRRAPCSTISRFLTAFLIPRVDAQLCPCSLSITFGAL